MDASLATKQGLEKVLQTQLPSPPAWKLSTTEVEAQVCMQYPNFCSIQLPQVQILVDTLHNRNLLARLTSDVKYGFFPPYKFTLVRAGDSFHEKKQHTETRLPWQRGDWVWSSKFSCRQLDPKSKTHKVVSLMINRPLGKKIKKSEGPIALFSAREPLQELRDHLLLEFGKLLREKSDSYDTFLRFCGSAQLHHLEKQRTKVEAQMVDIYETWIKSFQQRTLT